MSFVFDHPVDEENPWHGQREWYCIGTPELLLAHVVRLFEAPELLLQAFSPGQIFEGLSYLSTLLGTPERWLFDQGLSWTLRKNAIHSMVRLAERLFAREPCNDACFMWWDWLIFHRQLTEREADAILAALTEILTLPSRDCWHSALHGLGHLDHPDKSERIEEFLREHPNLSNDDRAYARMAAAGDVL